MEFDNDFNSIGAGFLPRLDTDLGQDAGFGDSFPYNENDFDTPSVLVSPEVHTYSLSPGPYDTLTTNRNLDPSFDFDSLSYTHTPPLSEQNYQGYNNSLADQLGQGDVAEQQELRTKWVPSWQDRTYTTGDRTSQDSRHFTTVPSISQLPGNISTPAQTTIVDNHDCLDFIRGDRDGIRLTAPEKHSLLRSELIFKVDTEGFGIQAVVVDNLSGLRAMQAALAQVNNGPGPTLQQLLVLAGHYIEGQSQSAEALWAILKRYNSRANRNYRLGVLNGGCSDQDTYEISVFEQENSAAETIWIYTDNVDSIRSDHVHKWSAITRPNIDDTYLPQSYASVAAVDPSLLHSNYSIPFRPSPNAVPPQLQAHPPETHLRPYKYYHRRGNKTGSRPIQEPSNNSFVCQTCQKTCRDLNALTHHERNHREKTLMCDYCHKRFLWPKDLARHLPMHTKEKAYTCHALECGKKFTRKDNLRRHYINDHPELPAPSGVSQNSSQR